MVLGVLWRLSKRLPEARHHALSPQVENEGRSVSHIGIRNVGESASVTLDIRSTREVSKLYSAHVPAYCSGEVHLLIRIMELSSQGVDASLRSTG